MGANIPETDVELISTNVSLDVPLQPIRVHTDVVALSLARLSGVSPNSLSEHTIYGIRCREFLKIGHSSKPAHRLISLQGANPYDLSFEFKITTSKYIAYAVEAHLHEDLSNRRVRGEWFRLSASEVTQLAIVDVVKKFEEVSRDETAMAQATLALAGKDEALPATYVVGDDDCFYFPTGLKGGVKVLDSTRPIPVERRGRQGYVCLTDEAKNAFETCSKYAGEEMIRAHIKRQ